MRTDHPPNHDNTNHFFNYLFSLQVNGMLYAAADVNVTEAAVVSLASVALTPGTNQAYYALPFGYFANIRPGTIVADSIVDVWVRVDGTQRSAKVPVYVPIAAPARIPFTLPLVPGTVGHVVYWFTQKIAAITIEIVAQRRNDANPAGSTIIFSEQGGSIVQAALDRP